MSLDVVGLALLSAAAWGAADPVSKLGMDRGGTPFQVSLVVVTVSMLAYWLGLLVRATPLADAPLWVIGLFVVTGVFATAIARVLSFNGVQRLGASVNSAGMNTRPVWASLFAVTFLGERITLQMGLGIVVVVLGLILIALSEGGDLTGWKTSGLLFPLTAAVIFGGGNVARRFGLVNTDVSPLFAVAINETAGLVGLLVILGLWYRRDPRDVLDAPRASYVFFAGSGLLNATALLALFEALGRGPVVVVDPLSSPTSIFAIAFTFLFLRKIERVTRWLWLGALLVVAGVILITGSQVLVL